MNKQSIMMVAVLSASLGSISNAAEVVVTGEGQAISAPDYVELSIQIESKCYPSTKDARKVNDEASRKIIDFLNSKIKKKDNYNTVIATGGYTQPYQTYYQDKYLCQNTFQKQSNIVFRTQNLANFEALFDEIQNVVYSQLSRSTPQVIESSISYATMSTPTPGISDALHIELEQKAIGLALKNAMAKLSALFGTSRIQNLKMTQASEFPPPDCCNQISPRLRGPVAMMSAAKSNGRAPVQFEEQEINKTIYFTFNFDDLALEINQR